MELDPVISRCVVAMNGDVRHWARLAKRNCPKGITDRTCCRKAPWGSQFKCTQPRLDRRNITITQIRNIRVERPDARVSRSSGYGASILTPNPEGAILNINIPRLAQRRHQRPFATGDAELLGILVRLSWFATVAGCCEVVFGRCRTTRNRVGARPPQTRVDEPTDVSLLLGIIADLRILRNEIKWVSVMHTREFSDQRDGEVSSGWIIHDLEQQKKGARRLPKHRSSCFSPPRRAA
jgi:hypothetical protein